MPLLLLLLRWALLLLLSAAQIVRPAAQQLHGSVDIDMHLGAVPLNSVLFPLASLELALDVAL
ncbi:hypothetical protein D3C80_2103970 [compost metagenome]